MNAYRQGAKGALLDIYGEAISGLKQLIEDIPDSSLTIITDPETADENSRSLQAILSHVVSCGYNYANSILGLTGGSVTRRDKIFHASIAKYLEDLDNIFEYTEHVFKHISDHELEQADNSLKIKTSWGQLYDAEQMMEHAIVHILRHKRQVEKTRKQHLL